MAGSTQPQAAPAVWLPVPCWHQLWVMDPGSHGRLCSVARLAFTLPGCAPARRWAPGSLPCLARGGGPVLPQLRLLQGPGEPCGEPGGCSPPHLPVWAGWGAGRMLPHLTEPCLGPGHSTWQSPDTGPSNSISVSLFLPPGSKTQGVVQGVTSGMVLSGFPPWYPSGPESAATLTRSEAN